MTNNPTHPLSWQVKTIKKVFISHLCSYSEYKNIKKFGNVALSYNLYKLKILGDQ